MQLKSKKRTTKYLQKASSSIDEKQIATRLQQIMDDPDQQSHKDLDTINTEFHQSLVTAAESLAPYPVH
eukprot:4607774-Ditylum_brightwellii.AAC.1